MLKCWATRRWRWPWNVRAAENVIPRRSALSAAIEQSVCSRLTCPVMFRISGCSPWCRPDAIQGRTLFEMQHLAEHLRFYLRFFEALNGHGFSLTAPLVEISDVQVTQPLLATHGIGIEQLRDTIRAHRLGGSEQLLSERGIELPVDVIDPSPDFGHRVGLVKAKLIDKLQAEFPEAQFRFNFARLEGLSYYSGLCLRISPATSDCVRYP